MGNSLLLGFLMIVGGLALVLGGVLVLTRPQPEPLLDESLAQIPPADSRRVEPLNSAAKGEMFEKWVVRKFSPDYFTIKDWRGDKYVEGIYAESSEHPDLEIEFRMRDIRKPFAVECKWRRGYERGEKPYIVWAEDRQIENYRRFARERKIPVFVVIGIGGRPEAPAEVYVVPLDNLQYSKTTADYLTRFRRSNVEAGFYYDYEKPALR